MMNDNNDEYDDIFISDRLAEDYEYESIKKERDLYKEKYLYAVSENENLKKRFTTERDKISDMSYKDTISKILPIIDDFERAIRYNNKNTDIKSLKTGFVIIYKKFLDLLNKLNIKEIETDNVEFDTNVHEAISAKKVDNSKKNKVLECVEKGYMINDTVIRHAKVIVGI